LTNQRPRNDLRYTHTPHTHTQTENEHTVRPCSTSSAYKKEFVEKNMKNKITIDEQRKEIEARILTIEFMYFEMCAANLD